MTKNVTFGNLTCASCWSLQPDALAHSCSDAHAHAGTNGEPYSVAHAVSDNAFSYVLRLRQYHARLCKRRVTNASSR
jgi:hypothetical protein